MVGWPVSTFTLLRAVPSKMPVTPASKAAEGVSALYKLVVTTQAPEAAAGK